MAGMKREEEVWGRGGLLGALMMAFFREAESLAWQWPWGRKGVGCGSGTDGTWISLEKGKDRLESR